MADPLPALDNAIAVRDTLARLVVDVYAGKVQPKVSAAMARLLNLLLRAVEAAARLEKGRVEADPLRKNVEDLSLPELRILMRDLEIEAKAIKASEAADCLELSKSLLR